MRATKATVTASTPDSEMTEVPVNPHGQHSSRTGRDNHLSTKSRVAVSTLENTDEVISAYEAYLKHNKSERSKGPYRSPRDTSRAAADKLLDRRTDDLPVGSRWEHDLDAGGFMATAGVDEREEGNITPTPATRSAKTRRQVSLSDARTEESLVIDEDVVRGLNTWSDGGARSRQAKAIPPEELFSRIPTLLKSSTSTFFGSTSSVFGPRVLRSPSEETQLHHRFSQPSLRQGQLSRRQSKSTLFIQQRIDSGSSVYPSAEPSECQSLDESVDVPDTAYQGQHATTMPSRHSRRDMDNRIPRRRSVSSYKDVGVPTNAAKFNFPWSGQASPARSRIHAEIVHEEPLTTRRPLQPMESSPPAKMKRKGPIEPQKRSSSSRAIAGMLNFVRSGITGGDYSSTSADNSDSGPASLTTRTTSFTPPANYNSYNSSTPRSGRTIQPQLSFYSTRDSSSIILRDGDDHRELRHQTPSLRREVAMETTESLGRFDYLGAPDLQRPRSLALRKSFTISIAKLREKVSVSGFKTMPRPGRNSGESTNRPAIKPRESIATMYDAAIQPKAPEECGRPAGRIPRMQKVRAVSSPAWQDNECVVWGSGAEAARLRRSNTSQTLPSRRPTASAAVVDNRRRRNTAYDDCVLFPFAADGGEDYEDEGPYYEGGNGDAVVEFQQREYDTGRSFWRETKSMAELNSRRASIGTAR